MGITKCFGIQIHAFLKKNINRPMEEDISEHSINIRTTDKITTGNQRFLINHF